MNLRLLMVEDSESDCALTIRHLQKGGYTVLHERVETLNQMKDALEKQAWDVIIADYHLPEFNARAALAVLQETGLDIPFIVVSGAIGEETAVALMRSGACDYLMKDNLARLAPAVRRDLTEARNRRVRKQAEDLLRLQSTALNAAANAIVITDLDGSVEWVNPAFTTLTGYTASEAKGKNPRDLVKSGRHDDLFYKQMWETIMAGKVWQGAMINRRKDGQIYYEEQTITPVYNAEGQISQFVAIKQDITSRKLAEERLRNSQEQYRYLVELSPDALFVNRGNQIDFVNPAALELFGATCPDQILKKSPFDIFHPDFHAVVAERVRKMIELHEPVPLIEEQIVRLDGTIRDVEVAAAPVTDSEGDAIQVILRDITERKRAEKLLYESNQALETAYDATLQGWSRALEMRERETAGHSQRVVSMTINIARTFGLSEAEVQHMRRGALLHDIGKMGIPDNVLLKPGPLDDDEWHLMHQHPLYAYRLLADIPYLADSMDIPYCHHEKWDGSGYPRGLRGEEIPLAARIFAVVDVWDALLADRPYRLGWPAEKIKQYLIEQKSHHFDPQVVDVFIKLLEEPAEFHQPRED